MILRTLKQYQGKTIDPTELPKVIKKALSRTVSIGAEKMLESVKLRCSKMLEKRRRFARKFEQRLMMKWKTPIDLLETLLEISYEIGAEFNNEYRKEASRKGDYLFDVLTRLHARACQTGFEILALLRNGLADGSNARWRTLHEIAVIALFIRKQGVATAKRFLDYEVIESYKKALEYQRCCSRLGYKPLTKKELESLTKMRCDLLKKYGKDFDENYGWIPLGIVSTRNFAEVEKSVGLDHLRPYYRMACDNVHSGTKGIKFKLGLIVDAKRSEILLAGPVKLWISRSRSEYGNILDPSNNLSSFNQTYSKKINRSCCDAEACQGDMRRIRQGSGSDREGRKRNQKKGC